MKRIVFINRFYRPDHSATAQLLTDLAQTLAAEGHRVSIVTSRQTYDNPRSPLPTHEVLDGVTIDRIWTSRFGRARLAGRAIDYLSFYCSALIHLLWHLQHGDTVIAKTDPPLISFIAAIAAKAKGAALINWLQDVFPEVASKLGIIDVKHPVYRLLHNVRNWTLRSAKLNIAIGELMASKIRESAGDTIATRVIPNWSIQPTLKPEEHQDNPLRREWQIADKFVVGYSGNLGRAHEFQTILDAALHLRDQSDIVFLFIGAGAQLQPVRDFAEKNNLQNIIFKPYQPLEKLACSLAAADVHLVSLQPELEGLIVPSKFYGIIAVGRPVMFIGNADGEIGTLIKDNDCGIAITPGDWQSLAIAVAKFKSCKTSYLNAAASSELLARNIFSRKMSHRAWMGALE